ncbi:CPLN2 protein, partial [Pachycephala philippinensis]|nr:CPLN2 protein [Pachycephala philippinensis]
PGWLLSAAGRPYLDCILHKNQRRAFGECPRAPSTGCQPPRITPSPPARGETPGTCWGSRGVPRVTVPPVPAGIEATTLFWPAKPRASGRPVLFQLHLWD